MRKTPLVTGEYYHVYNRGVDKRTILQDKDDLLRFLQSMEEFNCIEPIGSIFENSFNKNKDDQEKLVEFIAYCLNPNHFHFLLRQVSDNGISEFMKRLGGYTSYFNNKYKRSGALFQGKFKSKHIDSDSYLHHLSVYINLNNRFKGKEILLSKSSWEEYMRIEDDSLCNSDIIMDRYKDSKGYEEFALSSLEDIVSNKQLAEELEI